MSRSAGLSDDLLQAAKEAAAAGRVQAAASLLTAAISVTPDHTEAFLSFALLLDQLSHGDAPCCAMRAIVCSTSQETGLRESAGQLLVSLLQRRPASESAAGRSIVLGRPPQGAADILTLVAGPHATNAGPGVLLIIDAFRQGVPTKVPYAPSLVALQGSLRGSSVLRGYVAHPDQIFLETGHSFDTYLEEVVQRLDLRAILLIPPKLDLPRWRFPSPETLRRLEARGVAISILFLDALYAGPRRSFSAYVEAVRGVVVWDLPERHARPFFPGKILSSLGAPIDWTIYAPPHEVTRDIDVSFAGTVDFFPDRRRALDELRRRGLPVTVREGGAHSTEAYVDVLRRSRITLNFASHNPIQPPTETRQIKARTLEAMACGAMLLDQDSDSLREWFQPFVHYVPHTGVDDLAEKIGYYMANPDEARRIADAGHRYVRERWAQTAYWSRFLRDLSLG